MNSFDKSEIEIEIEIEPNLILRNVSSNDMDFIRLWKNSHREYFFHKQEISADQQKKWFESYLQRPFDLMLMVDLEHLPIGCMGARWQNEYWDIYNVICGVSAVRGQGHMNKALSKLLNYLKVVKLGPVSLKVLQSNPAVNWYKRQGFSIRSVKEEYYEMFYQSSPEREESR